MKRPIAALLGLLPFSFAIAQYRCVENGKTLFTDKPCTTLESAAPPRGSSPKIIGDPANSAYSSAYGDWRGQIQYQASFKGQPVSEAHAVVQTTISIDPQGKILGSSPENGCRMKGIASPSLAANVLQLDVTLSGCNFSRLNRRLTGTLALFPKDKRTQFWVYAHPVDFLNPGWSYDLKGTLRR
ncbi:DUF4124 domain-containing protein [Azonexus sp. R2A61]|uniref:DUF4124 domain-containing protein n=1 Tax=Azonexus sp. R2A61 TaxID=2744443 RepID=UPI001F15813D|nr:DUF4124 domain-containing protein [Azonexus sp. R2A61]